VSNYFFGEGFPPATDLSFTLLSRPRFNVSRITESAVPLVQYLRYSFESSKYRVNIWKNSQILRHLCHVLELIEDWDEAARYLGILAEMNRKTGDFHFAADALLRKGQALYYAQKLDAADACLSAGLAVIDGFANKAPPYRTKLRLLNYLSMVKSDRGDNAGAFDILVNQCLPLAEEKCSEAAVASVQNRLGIVCLRMKDVVDAKQHLAEALEFRASVGMMSEAAKTLFAVGRAYREALELRQAAFLLELSAILQIQNDDFEMLGETQFECATVYCTFDDIDFPIAVSCSSVDFPDRKLRGTLEKLREIAGFSEIRLRSKQEARRVAYERLLAGRYNASKESIREKIATKLNEMKGSVE
jgi:tetratricopeptide (TPR) repeat protein